MKRPVILLALLSFAILGAALRPDKALAAYGNAMSGPSPVRTPTPTPGIPSPEELKRSRVERLTAATPKPTATPRPTVTPIPTTVPVQTLEQLQSNLRAKMFDPQLRRGRIGIKIVSLNSGKIVFENESDKYFMPASNMKNFTVATALERLTPDFRFVTSVYAATQPDASGTLRGDLRVFGRGDVSVSTAFYNGDYYRGLDNLADAIKRAGVKRIDGALVGDESYFRGNELSGTWEWDDLQWYYGAGTSALPLNDNAVDVRITGGAKGGPCNVTISPPNPVYSINNTCTTGGAERDLRVTKRLDRNILDVSGTMPAGGDPWLQSIAVSHPAELFIALLKQRLELKGVVITGGARVLPTNIPSPLGQIEIAKVESPPLALIAAKTMKPSQNMYTETLLWTLGENRRAMSAGVSGDSEALGLAVVREFLSSIGIPADGIVQYDGSGLSRHDLITPSAVVTLYTYMGKQSRFSQTWRDSLTVAGVDGTLRNRFRGTAAEGNMRGKTGTIDQVSALSGYVTTAGGEQLVLSIVVNGIPGGSGIRTTPMDAMVVALANFNGRVD